MFERLPAKRDALRGFRARRPLGRGGAPCPPGERAYTAVEVLIAMTVMAIGAAGVISMQKASVQGNLDARKTDVATSIARTWVERLQRDAMQWTSPGPTFPAPANNMSSALVLAGALASPNTWILPDQYLSAGLSPAFDILGRDLLQTDYSTALFCVQVRMNWLTTAQDLIRADVRVVWARGIAISGGTSAAPPCGEAGDNRPDPGLYHAVYMTTALKGNPQ